MSVEPISRRKSCGECVKAKRKCDMQLPKCKRCQKKSIACSYPHNRASLSQITFPGLEFTWLDDMMQDPNLWSGTLQPQLGSSSTSSGVEVAVPDYLTAVEGPTLTTLARPETEAALHRFKTWPDKWLKEGRAPFIHPQLYVSGMPRSLQDAYAACAIYSTKTPDNAFIVFTVIESKANELLRSPNESSWTPLDLLAAVQALLIFQFIRLFDGDIRQRALAENAEPVLEAWTEQLQSRTEDEQMFTTFTAPSWRSWVFSESVRRTIAMSILLTGIYSLVKQGFCTSADKMTANSFTAQKRLWDSLSVLEWERTRQMYNPYWISKMNFDRVLQDGKGTELDDFGLVMMIMYMGQDKVDHWLASSSTNASSIMDPNLHDSLQGVLQTGDVGSACSSERF